MAGGLRHHMVSPLDVAWSLLKARGAGRRRQDFREAVDAQFPPFTPMSFSEAQPRMQAMVDHEFSTDGPPELVSRAGLLAAPSGYYEWPFSRASLNPMIGLNEDGSYTDERKDLDRSRLAHYNRQISHRNPDGKLVDLTDEPAYLEDLKGSTDSRGGRSATVHTLPYHNQGYLTFEPDGRPVGIGQTNQEKQFWMESDKREHLRHGNRGSGSSKRGLPDDTRYMRNLPMTDAGIPSGRRYVDPQNTGVLVDARNPDFEPEGEVIESKPFSYEDLL